MTHRILNVHPAMTAIAAVIALSTPSFAQSVDEPIAVTSAPAIEVAPAPAAADPLAPEAAAVKSTAARPRPVADRAARTAPSVAAAPAATSVPAAVSPFEPLPIETEAALVQTPIAEPSALADTNTTGSMISIAGVGALGVLALTGAGLVVRRRRRRAEDSEDAARRQFVDEIPDADAAPAMATELATPAMPAETAAVAAAVEEAHEPSPEIDGPVTELPEGFDVSRFGLHAQAAYNGPTEDNPSLSLKHRLSRASGMDQLAEREAEAEVAADAAKEPATEPAAALAKGDFMLRRAGTKPSQEPSINPAHSR